MFVSMRASFGVSLAAFALLLHSHTALCAMCYVLCMPSYMLWKRVTRGQQQQYTTLTMSYIFINGGAADVHSFILLLETRLSDDLSLSQCVCVSLSRNSRF